MFYTEPFIPGRIIVFKSPTSGREIEGRLESIIKLPKRRHTGDVPEWGFCVRVISKTRHVEGSYVLRYSQILRVK